MRGKLVPQDPNDEPASVLLEKIKAEKEELVKEKKIKKSKALPEITDDEKPFDIPNSWEWVRLGDAINLVSGRDIPKKNHLTHPQEKSMPYITGASNINEEGKITITEWVNNPSVVVNQGTLLLSVKGTIGKTAVLNIPCAHIARQIMGIENIYNLDDDYQKYYLQSYVGELQKKAKSMIPGISREDLLLAIFPLPPLSEQSRIAAKIAQLFALLRKVESSTQQYAELQTLLKSKVLDLAMRGKLVKQDPNNEPASVLLEKIKAEKAELVKEKKIKKSKPLPPITDEEKPFDIPDSWEWVRISDVLDVRDGTHDTPKYVADGIPLITSKNISNGKLDFTNINFISKDDFEKINERSKVDKGDIIFAMIGTIGNPVLVDTDTNFGIKNVALLKHFTDKLNMDFILDYLLVLQVIWNSNATGAVQKFVSLRKIRKSVLPLPPFKEQKKIVRKIDQIFRMIGE
jgi:type I restriction enzyme S subunit